MIDLTLFTIPRKMIYTNKGFNKPPVIKGHNAFLVKNTILYSTYQ